MKKFFRIATSLMIALGLALPGLSILTLKNSEAAKPLAGQHYAKHTATSQKEVQQPKQQNEEEDSEETEESEEE